VHVVSDGPPLRELACGVCRFHIRTRQTLGHRCMRVSPSFAALHRTFFNSRGTQTRALGCLLAPVSKRCSEVLQLVVQEPVPQGLINVTPTVVTSRSFKRDPQHRSAEKDLLPAASVRLVVAAVLRDPSLQRDLSRCAHANPDSYRKLILERSPSRIRPSPVDFSRYFRTHTST
jgi:hypothetical protein